MSTLGPVETGVVSNFVYKVLKEQIPDRVKRFAPALFFGGHIPLAEIDHHFEIAKNKILEEYSGNEAVQLFLSPEQTMKGGVLDPLFRKIFLGEPIKTRQMDAAFRACLTAHDRKVRKNESIKEVDEINRQIETQFLTSVNTAPFVIRSSVREVQETLNSIAHIVKCLETRSNVYVNMDNDICDSHKFSKQYFKELLGETEKTYISGVEGITKKADFKIEVQSSYVPIYVKDLMTSSVESSESSDSIHDAAKLIHDLRRILIRGPAGCGKTTLIQWVIWSCDPFQVSEEGGLPYFPIYIPLRRLDQSGIHKYSLDDVLYEALPTRTLKQHMPMNWLEELLSKNIDIILLIDGIDEVPDSKRSDVWEFINRISNEYSDLRMVLTSRHVSSVHLSDGQYREDLFQNKEAQEEARRLWNKPKEFFEFIVTPLSDADIISMIDKWFNGLDLNMFPGVGESEIGFLNEKLKDDLFLDENRGVLDLARTPLLCSMLCISYFHKQGKFPDSKRELYEHSVTLLVFVRDEARSIRNPKELHEFENKERLGLLKYIALIMQEGSDQSDPNQTVEVAREKMLDWIDNWKSSQPNLADQSYKYLDFLIERCAILREPSYGRIDFIHRSFMEYFAAERIAETKRPYEIRERITKDEWVNTLQFCMNTEAGGAYFGGCLVEEMAEFCNSRYENSDSGRRKMLLRVFGLAGLAMGRQEALSETLDEILFSVSTS